MNKSILMFLLVSMGAGSWCSGEEIRVQEMKSFSYVYMEFKGSYDKIPAAIQEFFGEYMKQGLTPQGALLGIYLNNPNDVKEEDLIWRIGLPVDRNTKTAAPLKMAVQPSIQTVYCLYKGPYEEVAPVYEKLMQFISENGYQLQYPSFERYLNDPAQVKPEDIETEIFIPVTKNK